MECPQKLKPQIGSKTGLLFAEVILDIEVPKVLDYQIPELMIEKIEVGMQVEVPIRNRFCLGFIFKIKPKASFPKVKYLHKILSDKPLISEHLFTLANWIQSYYFCSLNQSLRCIIPSQIRKNLKASYRKFISLAFSPHEIDGRIQLLKRAPKQALLLKEISKYPTGILLKDLLERSSASSSTLNSLIKRGWVSSKEIEYSRKTLLNAEFLKSPKKKLLSEQSDAVNSINKSLDSKTFQAHLLFGITGSGKTEVYLQAIEHALSQGKQVIVLIPEISLTEQTIDRFRRRFDETLAVFHHRLAEGEKRDEWHRMSTGKVQIVIGARSAIFAPLPNLGLIIVDEEHEGSYKSERAPTYNARDVALMRAKIHKCPVVLGSATPSIESFYNVTNKGYILNCLKHRATNQSLPEVQCVDMKGEWEKRRFLFSDPLQRALEDRFQKGEQSILFLNRRGFHTSLICQKCGNTLSCPHCSISLTYHKKTEKLSCHLCQHSISPPPKQCPECHSQTVEYKGLGTERVEETLRKRFPSMRILRVDADTTTHKGQLESHLQKFRTQKADVMIGTQMIAKGLDFPMVTLVGILNADGPLNIPDFRSSERAFQLITQVAGRSGRAKIPGKVIVQTFLPEHPTIQHAAKQDYPSFYLDEIEVRKSFYYPPFSKMVKLSFHSSKEPLAEKDASIAYLMLKEQLPKEYFIHPPHPSGYQKVKGIFRFQILLRGKSILYLTSILRLILPKLSSRVRKSIDIDPLSTFF